MSRKRRGARPNTSPTDARKDIAPKAMDGSMWDAASRLGRKALFWFPSLDPKDQITTLSRQAVNRNNTWLYNNLPPVRALIDGLALDEVDTGTWPKAITSSPEFNKSVTDDFHEHNKDPRFFSADGVESYYSSQMMMRRVIRQYGELFAQFLRAGDGIAVPTVNFINTWQCENSSDDILGSRQEGIRRSRLQRPVDYRFLEGGSDSRIVPAEDVRHLHDQFWPGQRRGMSCLAPCTRSLYRFDDIERAESSGTLLRTRMAYSIHRRDAGDDAPVILPNARKVEKIDTGDGGNIVIQRLDLDRSGGDVDVADVPAGFDMKVLESNRATITVDFLKWILHSSAFVTLYPPDYIFGLSGLSQGTLVRMVQRRVQRIKNTNRQFQVNAQFSDPWYTFWLWQRIKAGLYDGVKVPADWWKRKTIYPADDTVDLGREGRLYDERVESGKMSIETYHGMQGEDASDVEDENLAAFLRRLEKIAKAQEANPDFADQITYDRLFGSKKALAPQDPFPDLDDDRPPEKKAAK